MSAFSARCAGVATCHVQARPALIEHNHAPSGYRFGYLPPFLTDRFIALAGRDCLFFTDGQSAARLDTSSADSPVDKSLAPRLRTAVVVGRALLPPHAKSSTSSASCTGCRRTPSGLARARRQHQMLLAASTFSLKGPETRSKLPPTSILYVPAFKVIPSSFASTLPAL